MKASSKVENLMLILSSPSGAGKTTLSKKFNKNIKTLKYLFHIPLERLVLTKSMELIIFLSMKLNLKK